jgi:ABC-type sugar transport system substrate-binding protein
VRVHRWLPALAGAAVLALGAAACGGDDTSTTGDNAAGAASSGDGGSQKEVRIGMVGYDNKNNYTQWWWLAAQDEAKKEGVKVTLIDGKFDAKAQSAAVQNAITSKQFDALSILPVDGVSLLPVAKQAGDAGLKVVVGQTLGTVEQTNKLDPLVPQITSVVGQESSFQAEYFAKNIEAACDKKVGPGNPCKVGLMPGAATFPTDRLQVSVIKTALKGKPIKITMAPDGGYARPGGYKAATTFLQNNKDIDVLHANGDQMITGAVQAIKEAGLEPGKDILLSGYGGTKEGIDGIRAGTWFATVMLYPQKQAREMVKVAAAAARGEKVAPTVNVLTEPAGTVVAADKATLDEHPEIKGEWSEAAPR